MHCEVELTDGSSAAKKKLSCQQLATTIHDRGVLSYGQLKLYPFWNPLRGDPRFEKIVASFAPVTR